MSGAEPAWDDIYIEGKVYQGEMNPPCASTTTFRPDTSIPPARRIVAGRDFTWTDIYGLRPVGIVSESLARELWGSPSAAIGKRFREYPICPGMKWWGWSRMCARMVWIRCRPQLSTGLR